jgi:hypothetical protein
MPESTTSQTYSSKLIDWLLGGMSIIDATESVLTQFSVQLSPDSLLEFWQNQCLPILHFEHSRTFMTAKFLARDHDLHHTTLNDAIMAALQKRTLDLAINPKASLDDLRKVHDLVTKTRNLEVRLRHLAFQREQWELNIANVIHDSLPEYNATSYDNALRQRQFITKLRMRVFGLTEEQALDGYPKYPRSWEGEGI